MEFHWRWAFYSLGLIGLLYALPYFTFLKGVSEEATVETRKSNQKLAIRALIAVPTYRILCLASSAFVFVLWLLYTWLPNFLYDKFSLSLAEAGFTATVYVQGSTLIGLLTGGVLADWLYARTKASRFWLVCAGLILSAPAASLDTASRFELVAGRVLSAVALRAVKACPGHANGPT